MGCVVKLTKKSLTDNIRSRVFEVLILNSLLFSMAVQTKAFATRANRRRIPFQIESVANITISTFDFLISGYVKNRHCLSLVAFAMENVHAVDTALFTKS